MGFRMITVDAHIDLPWIWTKYAPFDLRERQKDSTVDFPRMKEGGLDCFVAALYLSDSLQDELGPEKSNDLIDWQIRELKSQKGCQVVDSSVAAIEAHNLGLVPIFLGLDGGRLANLKRLSSLRKEGVRYLTLTHNKNTEWADSATDHPKNRGLTMYGRTMVREAEGLGILVDVSHCSDLTCVDVVNMAEEPVLATHSGCRKIWDHPRNLPDTLIKSIAKTGGVVHVPFARRFVGPTHKWIAAHIDHLAQLLGNVDHIGIGSDLDGAVLCEGAENASKWKTACNLSDRGYKDEQVDAILGGNTLRMFQ